ncbi:YlmC/YmxH family sporulation protein [Alkaliphilus transvaalensis]|uniref:YlmC/YmxH family sporulation protein n=1 Tax=Alkaliphilus transvaalensis TaxID=114628 RepID=UPI0009FCA50A|nr:YlmC/YmxH family sporulation protein [Alkaliphilus transvaalensis]
MLRASDLTQKEVINITDGKRVGLIMDLEVDLNRGRINAIIIPSAGKFLGIFGKELEYEIGWNQIKKIGEDVILVEMKSAVEPQQYKDPLKDQKKEQFKDQYKEHYQDLFNIEDKKVVLEPEFVKKDPEIDEKE